MRRRGFFRRDAPTRQVQINHHIRVSPIRLVDENNEQIGVVETTEALRRAEVAELDLVMVSAQSDPPVCRIMDYGKWMYEQKKKEAKAKSHSKKNELKEVRLRPGTGEHDLKIKTDRARGFLADGSKVQFTILFRGRQMAHRDIGFKLFRTIADGFKDVAHVEMDPRVQGRRMTMMMAPGAPTRPKAAAPPAKPAAKPPASAAPPAAKPPAAAASAEPPAAAPPPAPVEPPAAAPAPTPASE